MIKSIEIPQPKPDFLLGNLKDINPNEIVKSFIKLSKNFDSIFKLSLPGEELIIVGSQELVNELCDEKRFDKSVPRPLEILRDLVEDGLFTAYTHEPNWGKAHRILMPAFGPLAIKNMLPQMLDISEQMLLKIERLGDGTVIDIAEEMTKLTLDTIALCAFDYRFNSFYSDEMPPFVHAMVDGLVEAGKRANRLPIQQKLMFLSNRKYTADLEFVRKLGWEIVNARKNNANKTPKKDLLALMLEGKDPVTGESLSEENIINQLITFLVAGHETTSGLLSFTVYNLLKNPETLKLAQAEVDSVLGNETLRLEHIPKLKYIEKALKESLRIYPTAPAFLVAPYEDTIIGDKYAIKKGQSVLILNWWLHRDKKVWGEDVEQFKPNRFSTEHLENLPPNSWKPFGNGQRGCIGRAFAMQEAVMALAMLLQRFDIEMDNPNYQLDIKESLTIKPDKFNIRTYRRKDVVIKNSNTTQVIQEAKTKPKRKTEDEKPLLIIYGSNSGSSENFAHQIASKAQQNGFTPKIGAMDEFINKLEKGIPVIIVTASYEGKPPHNALGFITWLESLENSELAGIEYTVFGCGHKDWIRTYQAIPRLVDKLMEKHGATSILERGEADASGDFFGNFENWNELLWEKIGADDSKKNQSFLTAEVTSNRTELLQQSQHQLAQITESRELVNMNHPLGRSKRHIEINLPEGMSYKTGDYLSILPSNPKKNVDRIIRRYAFNYDTQIIINKNKDILFHLPTGYPVSVVDIFSNYVELAQPATRKQIQILAEACPCPPEKNEIIKMAEEDFYRKNILPRRMSILDILEKYLSIDLSISALLEMLPPLKPRQYSISSSPLFDSKKLTLTIAVVNSPAWSGQGMFEGVASNYLAYLQPGSRVRIITQPASTAFHPPKEIETPMILVCAGTGLAPFRGFIQERALQKEKGMATGEILLFFGCDHPDVDYLYKEELGEWEKQGVVKIYMAFSEKEASGIKYVQHRLWQERKEVFRLFQKKAGFYVCGDGKSMAPGVRETFINIYKDLAGKSESEAKKWFSNIEKEGIRYVTDVFL